MPVTQIAKCAGGLIFVEKSHKKLQNFYAYSMPDILRPKGINIRESTNAHVK